jgi:large subunit ribosomal protein L15
VNVSDVLSKVKKRPSRKRCGRGRGSGLGKTSGRGHKGAASRAGWSRRWGYDGGQTSLLRRLPKRGFTNALFRTRFDVVNLQDLEAGFSDGDTVTLEALAERGLLRPVHGRLKVLGSGALKKKLVVKTYAASASAQAGIAAAGGKVELLGPPKKVWKPKGPPPGPPKGSDAGEKKEKKSKKKEGSSEGAAS